MHWTQIAVAAALLVYIGAFVGIMVVVRRSTGANPRGHARGHALAAWLNVLATLLLLVTAIGYPLQARSVDWFGRFALLDHPLARGVGVASLALAGVCLIWGEVSLGHSFRVALPERAQPLITHGIYRFTRNPLALSVDLLALGVLLLALSWLALISLVLNVVAYESKIRIEEATLREAHGAAYEAYRHQTGRYLPRLSSPQARDPVAVEWNHSLAGDFLWTNSNFCEAIIDVMTPATQSMWEIYMEAVPFKVPGYPLIGVIGGRPYINMSLLLSFGRALGIDERTMRKRSEDLWGRIPEGIDVPALPLSRWQLLRLVLPALVRVRKALRVSRGEIQAFVSTCPRWCDSTRARIRQLDSREELADLWRGELRPTFGRAWRFVRAALESGLIGRLRRDLVDLAGTADANALLSNWSGSEQLASLDPLVGVSKVTRGEMSREEYLVHYGHRGAHEMELSIPRPAEDPTWLDRQVVAVKQSPVDVERLLERQRVAFDAAWKRFEAQHPRQARSVRPRLERVAASARLREAARSEATRVIWVIREFALRVGELSGLREDVFFLTLDEMLDVLSGDDAARAYIPARREMHARYSALPPCPALIRGRFDPFVWAADPRRRSDLYDARASDATAAAPPAGEVETVTGFAGAAGSVEGLVRRLDRPQDGDQLRPGEILVTATTNVGWTLIFPRASAIVTDVGAPLSHAAIVARELGIPAVVGCGNATMVLNTGDRVRVDGGQGVVHLLERLGGPRAQG